MPMAHSFGVASTFAMTDSAHLHGVASRSWAHSYVPAVPSALPHKKRLVLRVRRDSGDCCSGRPLPGRTEMIAERHDAPRRIVAVALRRLFEVHTAASARNLD